MISGTYSALKIIVSVSGFSREKSQEGRERGREAMRGATERARVNENESEQERY